MSVKIRLRQQGRKNALFYRLVVINELAPRNGKYLEMVGWYNPNESKDENKLLVKADRVQHWLDQGAQLTEKAEQLVKQAAPAIVKNLTEKLLLKKKKACAKSRARRKARAKAA